MVTVLGGSWVGKSRVISRVTRLITHIRGLITRFRTTHESPSIWVDLLSPLPGRYGARVAECQKCAATDPL